MIDLENNKKYNTLNIRFKNEVWLSKWLLNRCSYEYWWVGIFIMISVLLWVYNISVLSLSSY